jgi:hypothetical protein
MAKGVIPLGADAISATPEDGETGGGGGGTAFAPLYDEITLQEMIHGDLSVQEYATATLFLNEALGSFRYLHHTGAVLLDIAEARAGVNECVFGSATVFKH